MLLESLVLLSLLLVLRQIVKNAAVAAAVMGVVHGLNVVAHGMGHVSGLAGIMLVHQIRVVSWLLMLHIRVHSVHVMLVSHVERAIARQILVLLWSLTVEQTLLEHCMIYCQGKCRWHGCRVV